MFNAAFGHRRCLVPAAVYYDWRDDPEGKAPLAVGGLDGDPIAFEGIWEAWIASDGETLQTFSTITTEANRQLSTIQPGMPVIIEAADWPMWVGETEGDVGALLRPAPEDVLRVWPVDKKVGNVKNDGPELPEPHASSEEMPTLV
jgi:putative SOS response-associated peptidase YedK